MLKENKKPVIKCLAENCNTAAIYDICYANKTTDSWGGGHILRCRRHTLTFLLGGKYTSYQIFPLRGFIDENLL